MHGSFGDEMELLRESQRVRDLAMSNIEMRFSRALKSETLTFGLPAERNLRSRTLEMLSAADMQTDIILPRTALCPLRGANGFARAVFLRQPEIIRLVSTGRLPIGIVGRDALLETFSEDYLQQKPLCSKIFEATQLFYGNAGFGHAPRIVLFTNKDSWIGSRTQFMRRFRGRSLQVVTEFPNIARGFFRSNDIDAIPVEASGAAEALVASGFYCAGICIAETRATLEHNGLVEIENIGVAPAVVIVNSTFRKLHGAEQIIRFIARRLSIAVDTLS